MKLWDFVSPKAAFRAKLPEVSYGAQSVIKTFHKCGCGRLY